MDSKTSTITIIVCTILIVIVISGGTWMCFFSGSFRRNPDDQYEHNRVHRNWLNWRSHQPHAQVQNGNGNVNPVAAPELQEPIWVEAIGGHFAPPAPQRSGGDAATTRPEPIWIEMVGGHFAPGREERDVASPGPRRGSGGGDVGTLPASRWA